MPVDDCLIIPALSINWWDFIFASEGVSFNIGINNLDINAVQGMDNATSTLTMLKSSMVNIYDADEVYPTMDASTNELNEFVENLTMQQLEMITDYFNSIPALQHDVESKCTTCDKDIRTTVKGLNSFF